MLRFQNLQDICVNGNDATTNAHHLETVNKIETLPVFFLGVSTSLVQNFSSIGPVVFAQLNEEKNRQTHNLVYK